MLISKYLPILITSFLLTIILLSNPNPKFLPRNLLSISKTNSICTKSKSSLIERYISKDFSYIPTTKSKSKDLISFVQNPTRHTFIKYLPRILIFTLCLGIGIFSIIGWFFYCCCCCCPCYCCKHNKNYKPGCCGQTSLIILLIFYGIIIIMSITKIFLSYELIEGINGTSCSLFKLYDTIINGEKEYIKQPRWEGIEIIANKLTQTKNVLNNISFDPVQSQTVLEEINKLKQDVLNDITKLETYVPILKERNSDVINKYWFLYLYTPLTNSNSVLGKMYNEYKQHIEIPYQILTESQMSFTDLYSESKTTFNDVLSNSISSINEIQTLLNELSTELLDKWYDVQSDINTYGIFAFYVLCIIFIIFGVLGFLSAFFYSCYKCKCLRIALHLTWNFLSFFSFIGVIIGSCFGILGIVSIDSIGLFKFIFNENLHSEDMLIFSNKTKAFELIDICFNENGNIEKALGLEQLLTPLNQVFNLSKYLNESYRNVNEYMFPITSEIKYNYTYIQYSSDWIRNKYPILKTLLEYADQKWLFNGDKCPFGDRICKDLSCQYEIEYCFYFEDWKDENTTTIELLFSVPSPVSEYSDSIKEILEYAKEINLILEELFEKDSTTNVDTIRTMHSSILGQLIGVGGNDDTNESSLPLKEVIGNEIVIRKKISDDIYNLFAGLLGTKAKGDYNNVNVFEILDCGFMKFNFNSLLEQLENGLSTKAYNYGIIMLIISFTGLLSNLFVLIIINKYKEKPNEVTITKEDHNKETKIEDRNDRISSNSAEPIKKESHPNLQYLKEVSPETIAVEFV